MLLSLSLKGRGTGDAKRRQGEGALLTLTLALRAVHEPLLRLLSGEGAKRLIPCRERGVRSPPESGKSRAWLPSARPLAGKGVLQEGGSLRINPAAVRSYLTGSASLTHGAIPEEQRIALGITESLVRLSVGVEDVEDLRDDLKTALSAI